MAYNAVRTSHGSASQNESQVFAARTVRHTGVRTVGNALVLPNVTLAAGSTLIVSHARWQTSPYPPPDEIGSIPYAQLNPAYPASAMQTTATWAGNNLTSIENSWTLNHRVILQNFYYYSAGGGTGNIQFFYYFHVPASVCIASSYTGLVVAAPQRLGYSAGLPSSTIPTFYWTMGGQAKMVDVAIATNGPETDAPGTWVPIDPNFGPPMSNGVRKGVGAGLTLSTGYMINNSANHANSYATKENVTPREWAIVVTKFSVAP